MKPFLHRPYLDSEDSFPASKGPEAAPKPGVSVPESATPTPEAPVSDPVAIPTTLGRDFEPGVDPGDSIPPAGPSTMRGRFAVRCSLEYWQWASGLAAFVGYRSLAALVEFSLRKVAETHGYPALPPIRVAPVGRPGSPGRHGA